jgi:hypothetical protein
MSVPLDRARRVRIAAVLLPGTFMIIAFLTVDFFGLMKSYKSCDLLFTQQTNKSKSWKVQKSFVILSQRVPEDEFSTTNRFFYESP